MDDQKRVNRFIGSMLVLGMLLMAAGLTYVGWYTFGVR
jgi:hypothetical protein